jgi:hypothetical protein
VAELVRAYLASTDPKDALASPIYARLSGLPPGIDLPDERSQLETRSLTRFGELRKHVYAQIQLAKQGRRPPQERKR